MKATHLQVEYLTAPLGLGNAQPRFFWHCTGGVTQTAYQLVVRRGEETLWDSGRVESGHMTQIAYGGKPLCSRDILDWSVRLWDEYGTPGEETTARFEMGLLNPENWQAKWISGNYKPEKNRRYPVDCFQKKFALHGEIVKARLYATARGVYDVTINGHRVEDFILAPGATDYRKRIQVQAYDVTPLLQAENTVELRLGDGWYRGSVAAYGVTNVYGRQTSVLAQLEVVFADGHTQTIVTDADWCWSNDGPLRFADLKDGELFDARRQPSYAGTALEVSAPEHVALLPADNVPVTEQERFTPVLCIAQDGAKILDFGQNIAGYLAFTVQGKPVQRLRLVCGELLDESGHVNLQPIQETKPADKWTQLGLVKKLMTGKVSGETALTPMQEIDFICSGVRDCYKSSFTVFGFRYVQVEGLDEVNPADFTAIAVYSAMEQTGDFHCSDERVNQLLRNTRWSMKSNFLDVPTDCPTRERLGWTGDAQIFFDTGAYLMNTAPFFAKWLRDMQDAQYENGLLPAVLPYNGVEMMYKSTGESVGWADAVYLVPYRYYKRYGDVEILRRCWPMMKRYAAYLLGHLGQSDKKAAKANPYNAYTYEKGMHLGEWLEPKEFNEAISAGSRPKHTEEATAYFHLTMTTMAEIADILGETDDAALWRTYVEGSQKAYRQFAELDTDRQAKLVRPLALGLLDGAEKSRAQQRLKQAAENYQYRVSTGFLSTPFLLPMLTEAGYADTAYKMLLNPERPGWLYEVAQGATTVWENWEGSASRNHYSPGAVCQWLFDTVAGIRVAAENRFVLAPVPGDGLTFAQAEYASPYGKVTSRWEKTETGTKFSFCVPCNTTAEIRLPDGSVKQVQAGEYAYEV